ncbi:unnamed protein product, partial [Mesorhabditis belari]|uniref:BZIP domain-containing protein n=1 Tax=Mesorhabditis belari TaxID=2138241 RepID=A0AAF3F5H6_9BILA
MATFGKDFMLANQHQIQSTPNSGAFSPNTEERIIRECGGIQTMCDLDFDIELNPESFGNDEDNFDNENLYAREMANMRGSPSIGSLMPESPIDVTADCPDHPFDQKSMRVKAEYVLLEEDVPMKVLRKAETPYMRESAHDLMPKPRGRPPKQVADTKRAQLAKNWRMRKQEEENFKTERLAMCESELADKDNTIDLLTQENNELKQKLKQQTSKPSGNPYDRKIIIAKEVENEQLRRDKAALINRLSKLEKEFEELKTIMQGVMWSG